jgi:hypothetical protein
VVYRFEKSELSFKAKTFFPIFDRLSPHLNNRGSPEGVPLGWNCHVSDSGSGGRRS